MVTRGSCVLVVVELERGADAAVMWSGGPFATVHVVMDGRVGPVLERWSMHDPRTGGPAIDVTPEALEQLTAYRLSDRPTLWRLARQAGALIEELALV